MAPKTYLPTAPKAMILWALLPALLLVGGSRITMSGAYAQAPVAAAAPAPQRGTVKAIAGTSLTVATDAGATVTIAVPEGVKISVLPVGGTELKAATPGEFSAITVGDRVLASVKAGDSPTSFTARQVVLMKSADIAKKFRCVILKPNARAQRRVALNASSGARC